MKQIAIITIIIFGCFQCSGKNKQRMDFSHEQHIHTEDSAVTKNDQAVRIYMNARGNVDSLKKAIDLLDEAIILNPKYRIAYSNKAKYLNIIGENKCAMEIIEEALKHLPNDPQFHFIKGIFYEKNGLPDPAEKSFQQSNSNYDKLITSTPDDFNLLLNRAFVRVFAENPEKSIEELTNLQSKYEKESDEHRQIQNLMAIILNINKNDYIREFWNE